ncbi:CsbD family protein [Kineococcus rubinsiae]|uniref:CsbD family protein n=1 Tax=Kineococcus rubinsiae TaxID=2609562 RepID=UPI00143069EA|nr:CsbD family protein [Kineococcus rubinsiae]NIZ92649.1 CsbD family protein [Kineococcus rubinsiae]
MSIADKAKNVVQQTVGKAEEAVGKKTDDAELTAQGHKDQSMGEARQHVEKVKDDVQDH